MSMDYTDTFVLKGNVPQSLVANATTLIPGSYLFSKSFNFKVLHAQVRVNVAGASATQSFQVQLSAADGTFTSNTVLATITITSSDAATTLIEARVADASTDVIANGTRCVRCVHVATSTDATLNYDFEVTCTAVGY